MGYVIIFWTIVIIIFWVFTDPSTFLFLLGLLIFLGIVCFFLFIYIHDRKLTRKRRSNKHNNLNSNNYLNTESETHTLPILESPDLQPDTDTTILNIGLSQKTRNLVQTGFDLENILIDGIWIDDLFTCSKKDVDFATEKLLKSQYPFSWFKSVICEKRDNTLIVEYRLPIIDDLPSFMEINYKKGQPIVTPPSEKRLKVVWCDISYKIVIRSLHELFASNNLSEIESIVFNGCVKSLDASTGHESEKCIMSIMVQRFDFESLNLSRIDAKLCFNRLKGISAHDLSTLTPIPPILQMSRTDKRFVEPHEIISVIDPDYNIAAMDWRDFENLIRDLFEKEFAAIDSEVKITRASRDGGVDAIVYDSDPIRGGKIIIQAKRYTNTVGVSAVRDLYGTVLNEGATKGILITTSDYGSDSYKFAKDKPISLLNGGNLLHLLKKHGYHARIDISEAKKLIQ